MSAAWRALTRVISVGGFLFGWVVRMRLRRPPEDAPEREAWRREFFRGAARGILDRLEVEVEVRGEFPARSGLLVSNHLGYLDVLVLAAQGPTVFVSRADIADWPVIGRLTRWCDTIFIDRKRKDLIPVVVEEMRHRLSSGSQVVFFPEATSGPGDEVMRFRASLFSVAVETPAPVHAAVLGYRTEPGDPVAREAVCWWGDAGFAGHFWRLAGLSSVRATVDFVPGSFEGVERKELANRCRRVIVDRFVPVTGALDPSTEAAV